MTSLHRGAPVDGYDEIPFAVYYAEWPIEEQGSSEIVIDVVLGQWGNATSSEDRFLISVLARYNPVQFMVVDATERLAMFAKIANKGLSRNEVLSSSMREDLFSLLDQIYEKDRRVPFNRQKES
jgi:hypothetical protein